MSFLSITESPNALTEGIDISYADEILKLLHQTDSQSPVQTMRETMKGINFHLILLLIILTSCSSIRQGLPTGESEKPPFGSPGEFRGVRVSEIVWHHENVDTVHARIGKIIRAISKVNINALFLQVGKADGKVFSRTVRVAKETGLAVYAWMDLDSSALSAEALPHIKSRLKERVRQVVLNSEINGLHFSSTGNSSDHADLIDLIEDLISEALLIKSHLTISEDHSDATGFILTSLSDLDRIRLLGSSLAVHPRRQAPDHVMALNMDSLFVRPGDRVEIKPYGIHKTVDSHGWLGVILPEPPGSLDLVLKNRQMWLSADNWNPPYRYRVLPDGSVERTWPWVEFRRLPADTTTRPNFHVLCKSDYPATPFINDDSLKMYETGVFFSTIEFQEGVNRIRARVVAPDSSFALYEREVTYKKTDRMRSAYPLWIDTASIQPAVDQSLLAEDRIRIRFTGSKGQEAYARIKPGKLNIPLHRTDFRDYGVYQADLPLNSLKKRRQYRITLELRSRKEKLEHRLRSFVQVQDVTDFPMVKVTRSGAILTYSLGRIRLGGPIRAEYERPGAVFQVNGRIGNNYRLRLNRNEVGFMRMGDVEILPKGYPKPGYYVQSLHISPSEKFDSVSIPYPEPVPYTVTPEPDLNRIRISLYGVQTSSTWIQHKDSLRVIKRVGWQQVTPETYEILVHLKTPRIWGYKLEQRQSSLVLRVQYPPELERDSTGVCFRGLNLAIEAGHGGRSLGAVGLSGMYEKDVNLDVAQRLEALCRAHGINVLQIRDRDRDMALSTKRDTVLRSDADLFISIHANAGGSSRGYLAVPGTSTYYHNPFWADFAEIMYGNLLELPLDEFGVVGSFNYRVTRMSSRPAILVEQAFMSHAEDEEKLYSPEFRARMAQKIFEGIADYLSFMLDETVKICSPKRERCQLSALQKCLTH